MVDQAGVRKTVCVEATSESRSNLIPCVYDERAFRGLAGHLLVDHALKLAAPVGPYAELEVYLRASALLSAPGGLELVSGESPVGSDPASEVQLAGYAVWGDLAVFVTMIRATGEVRVAHFN